MAALSATKWNAGITISPGKSADSMARLAADRDYWKAECEAALAEVAAAEAAALERATVHIEQRNGSIPYRQEIAAELCAMIAPESAAAAQMALVFRVAKVALLEAAMAAVNGLTEDALTDLILVAATIRDDLSDAADITAPTEAEAEIADLRRMGETE